MESIEKNKDENIEQYNKSKDKEEDNINREYKIIDELGKGTFSTVYKVKQYETDKEYAAKVPLEDNDEDTREEENYKVINTINSETIIKLIISGKGRIVNGGEVSDDKKYLILELCSKGDLFQYVYHGGKIKEIYCKIIFEKILLGVKELHEHGIYHLDLKTPNIFLDENFNPKIGDFGSSLRASETIDGQIQLKEGGTPGFRSPQIEERKIINCIKADIFSLGAILFNLVTNKYGFGNATGKDTLYKYIKNGNIPKYWEKTKLNGLTGEFKNLYFKMVSYHEKDRPQNIDEILNHRWFDEIRLNPNKKMLLNEEVRLMFVNEKEQKVKDSLQKDYCALNPRVKESFEVIKDYFKKGIEISKEKSAKKMHHFIKFNQFEEPIDFMNKYIGSIESYIRNCKIEKSEKNLNFKLIIGPKDGNYISENESNSDDEEDDECFDNIQINRKLVIKIKLFKAIKEGLILRFTKREGDLMDYYRCLKQLYNFAEEIIR